MKEEKIDNNIIKLYSIERETELKNIEGSKVKKHIKIYSLQTFNIFKLSK